jgi:mono/diheme cytochrome c family protein
VRRTANGNAAQGERLITTVGCKACHVVTPEDREQRANGLPYDIGPDLGAVARKVNEDWLYDWIKNPKHYSPETRMPSLRLSDQEAADIVAYLMQLGRNAQLPENYSKEISNLTDPALISEGRALVRNFGCHGCHVIPSMEKEGRVSVSLNEFGAKFPDELFYGDALANGTVQHKTWEGWTLGKLQNSRAYATEAVIQRMPNYQMADSDAVNMAVLLRSWDGRVFGERYVKPWGGREESIEKGRLLARQLNCTGCHIIEGDGGDIRPSLISALTKEGLDEITASAYAPPNLLGEGKKVQSEWLFQFLKEPKTGQIRPWLRTRMPTFALTDEEANTLINYFKAEAEEAPGFTFLPEFQMTGEQRTGALKLTGRDYFACVSCHQQGAKKPEGPPDGWAPDLAMAKQRLDPNWIAEWIRDPQKLLPGTRMPSFYPDSYPPDVLNGDPDKQIVALRNYLLSL